MPTRFTPIFPARIRLNRALLTAIGAAVCGGALLACLVLHPLFIPVPCDEQFQIRVHVDGEVHAVQVESFAPKNDHDGPHPAILFLHGVEGPERYRPAHTRSCRWLADQGYTVFFIHYLDAVPYRDLWHLRDDGSLDQERIGRQCRADAERWTATVLQTLKQIASRADVDSRFLALDGISLGGFLALEVADEAARDSTIPDVSAVVVNWGAQFELTNCQHGFPPTLHIHGECDEVVPLDDARNSVAEICAAGSEAELIVIPRAPHVARSGESDTQTLRFLAKHLRSGPSRDSGDRLSHRAVDR